MAAAAAQHRLVGGTGGRAPRRGDEARPARAEPALAARRPKRRQLPGVGALDADHVDVDVDRRPLPERLAHWRSPDEPKTAFMGAPYCAAGVASGTAQVVSSRRSSSTWPGRR